MNTSHRFVPGDSDHMADGLLFLVAFTVLALFSCFFALCRQFVAVL